MLEVKDRERERERERERLNTKKWEVDFVDLLTSLLLQRLLRS